MIVNNEVKRIRKEVTLLYVTWDTVPLFDWRDWGKAWKYQLGIYAVAAETLIATFRIQVRRVAGWANLLGIRFSVTKEPLPSNGRGIHI
jgi:hypothetical protein